MTNKDMIVKVRNFVKKKLNREEYCTVNVGITYYASTKEYATECNIYYNGSVYYTGLTFNDAFKKLKESFKTKKVQIVECN